MLTELETARIFAASSYLKGILLFRLVTSGIGLICMTVLEWNRKKIVVHKSLKLLLNWHGFWTLLLCLSTFTESLAQIYAHLTMNDPSDLLLTPKQCLIRMIPQFFGTAGSVASLFVMSIERYEASRKIATYEFKIDGNKFVILQLSITIINAVMNITVYEFPARIAHCSVRSMTGKALLTGLVAIFTTAEIFTIFLYRKSLKFNESIHKSERSMSLSLSEKYQLNENIRTLRLLLPIVISHTTIILLGAVGFFYFEIAGFPNELYPIFEDTINVVYLQGIAMPLIFLHRFRTKRTLEIQVFTANLSTGQKRAAAHDGVIKRGW